jgi:hypothetical protein
MLTQLMTAKLKTHMPVIALIQNVPSILSDNRAQSTLQIRWQVVRIAKVHLPAPSVFIMRWAPVRVYIEQATPLEADVINLCLAANFRSYVSSAIDSQKNTLPRRAGTSRAYGGMMLMASRVGHRVNGYVDA